ncbi:metallophosphoesterase family protein [Sphingomonas nostoxanthinifaciens]|uniref:metallophosphoesterase family protein n=1 Tax=Sphingomonas nostoxanthinifaciens TaxID=2872652 RepID=UPI001CC20FF8|nr:metallophosphoesterase [Sphingomonas nostoxanthinifaciens]UAK24111.1 metallophosphoesterase [Sphingomonas nostoxanthinifaciens]
MARLFHVSDLHFGREDAAALRWFADAVRAERPDAVICTGDLTMRARRREFAAAAEWLKALAVPVTVEPGNHDLPYFNPAARLLDPYRRFRAVSGAVARPLALPDVILVPLKTTARLQLRRLSWGRVSRSGLVAALSMLHAKPPGAIALVACHHPLVRTDFTGHGDTAGGVEALRMLAEAGADAVLSGHVHDGFDMPWRWAGRTVRLIGAGTLSERLRTTPPSFNELRVADGALEAIARAMPA